MRPQDVSPDFDNPLMDPIYDVDGDVTLDRFTEETAITSALRKASLRMDGYVCPPVSGPESAVTVMEEHQT